MLWIISRLRAPARGGRGQPALAANGRALQSPTKRCCMQRRLVIIGLLLRLGVRGLLQQTRRLRPLRPLQQLQSR